ncbi:His Kinase A (phospho-acceptor) domain-containing protein [Amycolatopsis xylanica]|uniref:histidine kinase n=2 Tax=Amycolatopsis xylanica TaxID=589385 RepID=A0A1H3M1W5_9PSEU|nr:His Kinase A (phospho-acceptor) domain-containing protein [Amycolatopsis xylanica]
MLRRTRRVLTVQIWAVSSLLVAVLGALAWIVVLDGQHETAEHTIGWSIGRGVGETPPGCVWLFTEEGRAPAGTAPAGMPLTGSWNAVAATRNPVDERVSMNGTVYTVRTEIRDGRVVQAFFDEHYQIADREHLLTAFLLVEVLVVVISALVGHFFAGRAIRPLGEALRRQRTFVADASHELRAPLTRLHTRAQLLARRDPDPELDQLVKGTRELGEVVEDLLLSAQLQASKPPLEPVEMGLLAEEAVAGEAPRARERGLRIELHRDERPYLVRGVQTALRRVLTALLDNAIGHTPPGGLIEVRLGFTDGRHVEISVRDTGVGFEQSDAERLFERFARGEHGDGRRFGLGLALVREVVAGHGGTISAQGVPGDGATFTLRLRSPGA